MNQNNQITVDDHDPEESEHITHVRVTNHNTFDIEDRYDNRVYQFPSNKTVTITTDVARHIFGMGDDYEAYKQHCMRRFGWNTPEMVKDARNLQYFKNLEIRPVRFRLVEVPSHELQDPAPAHVPVPDKRRKAAKAEAYRSPVVAAEYPVGEDDKAS